MPCRTINDHRWDERTVARGYDDIHKKWYRDVQRICTFEDCGRVQRIRTFGQDTIDVEEMKAAVRDLTTGN